MESKNVSLGCIFWVLVFVGFVACDTQQDREKCANQLVALSTCLPFVGGQSKAPPPDCCTGFKQVLKDSRECICLLIKDRDDPSLNLKINATLALSLPARCNVPVNNQSVADCPALLHLPPNSPDAKIFDDFANSGKNTTAAATGSSSTTADQKGDGGQKRRWLETQMGSGLLIAVAALHIFINL